MLTPRRAEPMSSDEIGNGCDKNTSNTTPGPVSPGGTFENGDNSKEFLSTGRTGRRNALPNILGRHAETGLTDLSDRFEELSTHTGVDSAFLSLFIIETHSFSRISIQDSIYIDVETILNYKIVGYEDSLRFDRTYFVYYCVCYRSKKHRAGPEHTRHLEAAWLTCARGFARNIVARLGLFISDDNAKNSIEKQVSFCKSQLFGRSLNAFDWRTWATNRTHICVSLSARDEIFRNSNFDWTRFWGWIWKI